MVSLITLKKNFHNKVLLFGIFALFALVFFFFGSFFHNHADDPFHVKSHDDCPVSVLANTPSIQGVSIIYTFVVFLPLGMALGFNETFLAEDFLFFKSSRAPPYLS